MSIKVKVLYTFCCGNLIFTIIDVVQQIILLPSSHYTTIVYLNVFLTNFAWTVFFTWNERIIWWNNYILREDFLLSKSESVKFSLIESVICLFTDSTVKKYFSLLNQLIFTGSSVEKYFSLSNQSIITVIISEIWLIYSNLLLAIWISQISLIISRFWLIQI